MDTRPFRVHLLVDQRPDGIAHRLVDVVEELHIVQHAAIAIPVNLIDVATDALGKQSAAGS
jgi:hypothetical protein